MCRMVSQEKWDKTKLLILEMTGMVERDCLPLARLLQIRGFLMYVVRTYPWINPYIKGLHLTIDSWRLFRGADGFKLRGKELENALAWGLDRDMPCRRGEDTMEEEGTRPHTSLMALRGSGDDKPPVEVKPVSRFMDDLAYLSLLTEGGTPPKQLYQAKHASALFVIGDASMKAKGQWWSVVSHYGRTVSRECGRSTGGASR